MQFRYFSIAENIKFCITKNLINLRDLARNSMGHYSLTALFNIDGLPLYRSSNLCAWPILIKLPGCFRPLPVALFCGTAKPPLEKFFAEFIKELQQFVCDGVTIVGRTFKIVDIMFVCDAPAKAYITQIRLAIMPKLVVITVELSVIMSIIG